MDSVRHRSETPPPLVTSIPSPRFGRYVLTAKIGEGGMSEVYRAEVTDRLGDTRTVVLKLLRRSATEEMAELFDFESDLMALLDHPNLVRRFEVGDAGGRRFLAMEDMFGGDLSQLIRAHGESGRPFPLDVALRIVVEVLHGLAYFHQARTARGEQLGLVHGDINPANMFLSVLGEVKLGDFGVATSTKNPTAFGLREGVAAGKLHYLSPEQAGGTPVCAASDLFSMGVVLFELVVGFRPFGGATEAEVLARIRAGRPELPPALVPPALAQILRRALAPTPRERHGSAGELCGELVRFQLDQGLQCGPTDVGDHVVELLGVVS